MIWNNRIPNLFLSIRIIRHTKYFFFVTSFYSIIHPHFAVKAGCQKKYRQDKNVFFQVMHRININYPPLNCK